MNRVLHPTSSGFGPSVHIKNVSIAPRRNVSPSRSLSSSMEGGPQWKGYQDCVSSQAMLQNYTNFKRSGLPSRMMQWIDGAWVDIQEYALSRSKEAFAARSGMAEIEVDGNDCIFDFYRMLIVDVGSGLQRSLAWIDVDGACFFPKFFVDESLIDHQHDEHISVDDDDDDDDNESCGVEIPKIEIEIKVGSSSENRNPNPNPSAKAESNSRKRKGEEEEDDVNSYCNSGKKRQRVGAWPNVRLIGEEERSYGVVKDLFMSGMEKVSPGVRITSIRQFARTGLMEEARWEAFHKQMEMTQAARGKSNTVFAWHGASRKGIFDILAHGFGCPTKVPESRAHGVGVYFSPARAPQGSDELAEADDDGEKHLLLCRVILGNVEKVEAGSQQFYPSTVNFDSGVDDLVNPKYFVVWSTHMNTHILPECVVSYKCSDNKQGATQGGEQLQWIPNGSKPEAAKQFFSRLGGLLPSNKVEQLKALCMTFKAGNMAKDMFIRQLRSMVGNEMLHFAMTGIQGSH